MRRVKFGRPSPAMAVACLALFVAIGGGAYAAARINTDDIKREAVTGPKIAKRTIKSSRIAADNLKGKKLRDDTVDGTKINESTLGTVPNSDTVDGKHADCDAGTQLFLGQCWDSAARAAQTWIPAAATCSAAGGYLPAADQLRGFQQAGNTLAGTDEWTNDITEVPSANTPHVVTVSNAGAYNFTNGTADSKGFHCVFPLVH
jgi:hypothetical protein